ncbi:MAG: DNA polymerase III subunit alpha [Proteobacteria bacterium]|nr:DNA polymerase III subunit alpha [Pseudomonadota bacterium]HQR04171.1 DNA polymerase III subunit alpha [Rhodocyclaceae bacterium]
MSPPRFVHLRLHSEYSITDGIVRIDDVLERVVADGMPALALTDLANLFGMVKFYSGARSRGVKPVIGADVWIRDEDARDPGRDSFARILLLVKNQAGYLRLCELLTSAYLAPRRQGRAEISLTAIANGDNSGLIALSGGPSGEIGQLLAAGKEALAQDKARRWAALFPDSFYLEIQRPHGHRGHPQQEALVGLTVALAGKLDLPVVATHPIQFLDADDFAAHEARVCIAEGYVLADTRRPRNFTEAQCFRTQAEMTELFSDLPAALENSLEIARRCNLTVTLGKNFLPDFPTPDGISLDQHLANESRAGLEKRLLQLYPDPAQREQQRPRYADRLEFEIQTIQQMGFPGYFLIVADFIQWSKSNGVPVGPGRGSGAGSLVAYSLLITDLDPLYYELLFERFLNPERVSMPDFDVDFCQEGRDRVIQYVKEKYGSHCVSQIATFGTMAAKAVIRDVGRVLDLGFNFVDQFAKLIPNELGITLEGAIAKEPQIRARIEEEEGLRTLWDLALKLEGVTRNVGMHAGGVLIAPGKLTDFCPLYSADGGATTVSQFDKDDVEKAGLVKFDFLGLRTLTILNEAVDFANRIEGGNVDLPSLPLDDRATYDTVFKNANTTAVFQFESRGMKDMLVQAKPDRLEDLIALNALYRPGPMDLIPSFINRKHKREAVTYLTPNLEKVLSTTYGIMVYQEQVMQTAQVVAGYSLGGADMLRRAMGKKKPEEMAKQRAVFIEGAGRQGIGEATANEIFDYIDKFAGYGFNKSHAAAYSLVAYHTAWLKCHHPASFTAATLSSEMADTDKVQFFCADGRASGLTFLPPDINASGIRFQPVDGGTIRYGLGAIKGTGEAALSVILRARSEGGPFHDLFDFCRRIDKRVVNRRVIEALVRAGAFDAVDDHRARLLASVGVALEAAEQAERNALQGGLFDLGGGQDETAPRHVDTPRWGEREQLLNEKQALGFFLSGHPFNAYRQEIGAFIKRGLGQIAPQREPVLMAGVVLSVRTQMGRRGKMCFVTLDDGAHQLEVMIFNELWEAGRQKIREDELLLVEAKVQEDTYSGGLRIAADTLMTLAEARGRYAKQLYLSMNGQASADRLRTLLTPYRNGPCPVRIAYRNGEAAAELILPEAWSVRLEDGLLADLQAWLTSDNVKVKYA